MYNCAYTIAVNIEWDPRKAAANLKKKHGVDFADAATVLFDAHAATMLDEHEDEDRYVTLGSDACGRILVIVYASRGERIRLISARKATRRERTAYEG